MNREEMLKIGYEAEFSKEDMEKGPTNPLICTMILVLLFLSFAPLCIAAVMAHVIGNLFGRVK